MPYQIGDTAQFTVASVIDPGSLVYSYVWRWWDQAIQVGTNGTAYKRINMGGDPINGNRLIYSCTPVSIDGSSVDLYGTITANNSPFIAASPSASKNDDYYGYSTTLYLTAYSIDRHLLSFEWYDGSTYLGTGTLGLMTTVDHTWRGNDTQVTRTYTGRSNYITLSVYADKIITCRVTDIVNSAVTVVEFNLRGKLATPLDGVLVVDSNALTTDATSQSVSRIGPGNTMKFVAYVTDIDGLMPTFAWEFSNARNWTVQYIGAGVNATLPDGSFSSTVDKAVGAEIVVSGEAKACTALCRITGNALSRSAGQFAELQFSVLLLKNNEPTGTTVTCAKMDGTPVNMVTELVDVGEFLVYSAVTTDPDLDVIDETWSISNYPYPTPFIMYGPKIIVSTAGFSPGDRVTGSVQAVDRMGASRTDYFSGPQIQ